MNQTEYNLWVTTARRALAAKYGEQDIDRIIRFFDSIRGSHERDLVGGEVLDGFRMVWDNLPHNVSVFDTMMSRLFIYAPAIVEKYYRGEWKDGSH